MNLQQLIELAILDAMGLLDEEEQHLFESAFRRAAPAVQAQVRREQTRLSRIESLLPEVTPPAGLRAAVLEAVRREIAAAAEEEPVAGVLVPPMIPSQGVSPAWRLASVGLAAAAVVFGLTTLSQFIEFRRLTENLQTDSLIAAATERFGTTINDVLFDRDTRRVVFRPVSGSEFNGEASVFLNPEWKEARFFYRVNGDGRPLRLAIVDEEGRVVKYLAELKDGGVIDQKAIAIDAHTRTRLAILTTEDNGQGTLLGMGEIPGPSL